MVAVVEHIESAGVYLADNTMVWTRWFAAALNRVWDAIATKDGLSSWFMPTKFEIAEHGGSLSNGVGTARSQKSILNAPSSSTLKARAAGIFASRSRPLTAGARSR